MRPSNRSLSFVIILILSLILSACTVAPAMSVVPTDTPAPTVTPAPPMPTPAVDGTLVSIEFTSQALAGNLIGDPNIRELLIWLPPSYYASDRRYPVIYVLHYQSVSSHGYDDGTPAYMVNHLTPPAREMISDGTIGETILVFPDAMSVFKWSNYLSSPALGDYETYLAHEIVNYVDANYRTIAHPDSRGITGYSSGGGGAMHLGLKYPNVFSVVAASGGIYDYDDEEVKRGALSSMKWFGIPDDIETVAAAGFFVHASIVLAATVAPNLEKPPLYLDMPFEMVGGEAQIVPEVWQRMLEADPIHDVYRYLDQPERLRAILILHGTKDDPSERPRKLVQVLADRGIEHEYVEWVAAAMRSDLPYQRAPEVLQFMSENLVFEATD